MYIINETTNIIKEMSEINFSKFKKLSVIEHILKRPARFIGTMSQIELDSYVISEEGVVTNRSIKYSPAFLKLFDELITNSADFAKRLEGKHLDKIEIKISKLTGVITVRDNGGIPVQIHPEYNQWLPDMLLGELRSGSNFNDEEESEAAGQNGEGGSLAGVFSTQFILNTADGKKQFTRQYLNNFVDRDEIVVKDGVKDKFTEIVYVPDYQRFGFNLSDNDNYDMLVRRTWEVAACNPNIKVFFNNKHLKVDNFKEFIGLFTKSFSYQETLKWQVGVAAAKDEFKQISFINTTQTTDGGTHVEHVVNQIVNSVRVYVEKKTKQDVKPNDIRQHLQVFINCAIDKPRYNSQTKEKCITEWTAFGSRFEVSPKFLKDLIASEAVKEILEWAERRKKMQDDKDLAEVAKANKKKTFHDILKYEPAGEKVNRSACTLYICEGDSAKTPFLTACDPNFHGLFPIRGKSMNVRDQDIARIKKNVEFISLMRIIGLEIGRAPELKDLRYGRLVVATDQDYDGNHIMGLILNLFQTFWPSLLKSGFVHKLNTPIVRVEQGKDTHEFFTMDDYEEWSSKQTKKYESTYLKGLGGNESKHFKKYLSSDDFLIQLIVENDEDFGALDTAFSKESGAADKRKIWLYGDKKDVELI